MVETRFIEINESIDIMSRFIVFLYNKGPIFIQNALEWNTKIEAQLDGAGMRVPVS